MSVGLTLSCLYESGKQTDSKGSNITAIMSRFGPDILPRGYGPRGSRGEWVTVHLPTGFLKKVDIWADAHGCSRNYALSLLLQNGLLAYLSAYKRFMEATAAVGAQG